MLAYAPCLVAVCQRELKSWLIDWLTKRGWGRNTRTDSDGRPVSGRVSSCRPPSKKSNERDNIRFNVTCYEYVCQCEILHSIRIFYVGCLVHRIDFYGLVTLTKTANTDAPSLHSCALQRVAFVCGIPRDVTDSSDCWWTNVKGWKTWLDWWICVSCVSGFNTSRCCQRRETRAARTHAGTATFRTPLLFSIVLSSRCNW